MLREMKWLHWERRLNGLVAAILTGCGGAKSIDELWWDRESR